MRRQTWTALLRLSGIILMLPLGWNAAAAQRIAVTTGEGLYPRMVRLQQASQAGRIVASITAFPGGAGTGEAQIYASDNNGASFARVGTIRDALFSRGLCCGSLYELPRAVGAMPAGTLLWTGAVGGDTPGQPMQLRIYRSNNRGASWSYVSNCVTATRPRSEGGLWEPELIVSGVGTLMCMYADETVPGFSQMIQQVTSSDGINWSAPTRVIASTIAADRPGMPVVRRLGNGRYFLAFELCGPAACTVFSKGSSNGLDWSAPSDMGVRVETDKGRWFRHTPTVAWSPVAGTANGRLFLIGQIMSGPNGIEPGNGRTVFYNDSADGSGPWKTMAAPVTINAPPSTTNYCQNYSSPLLPAGDGATLQGLASDFDGPNATGVCRVWFGSTAIAGG